MLPAIKASLFGVPLPLCSCSVIPVSAAMREQGASRSAVTAFLLSTPQTGVDSIAVTYAVLGPVLAIFRPIAAFVTGIVGALLVLLFDKQDSLAHEKAKEEAEVKCCHCHEDEPLQPESKKGEIKQPGATKRALEYGFVTLARDIGMPLIFGIFIAGLMSALIPQHALEASLGAGFLSIIILMLAGVPLYVCATASVPIAAAFIHMGASPGAALAFLISGPATNAATLTTAFKILGKRSAFIYLFTVAFSALLSGLLLDALAPFFGQMVPELVSHDHVQNSLWLNISAIVLIIIILNARFRAIKKS